MTILAIDDIKSQLTNAQVDVAETSQNLSEAQFFATSENEWGADGYLKHLILSVKPFARSLKLPKEQMAKLFGTTDSGSMTYDELVATYEQRIAEGMRAENASNITPIDYKMPDDVEDVKAYLIETWDDANNRMLANLTNWTEDDLDTYVLPHPAIGNITIREMFYFTIHHNQLHCKDIARKMV